MRVTGTVVLEPLQKKATLLGDGETIQNLDRNSEERSKRNTWSPKSEIWDEKTPRICAYEFKRPREVRN
jgi:hypothetical protein